MKLSDSELLELSSLCDATLEGTLTEKEKARLSQWLIDCEEARRHYVRYVGMSASLCSYANEMQVEEPDRVLPLPSRWFPTALGWGLGAVAAALALVFWLWPGRVQTADQPSEELVARLSGTKDCHWAGNEAPPVVGDHLHRGQQLELASGFAEINFDCGAQLVLQGPASLEVGSAWDAVLKKGMLKASVPAAAVGFRISNPSVEVVDLGTEFTMAADPNGSAEVLVLKGSVQAEHRDQPSAKPLILLENQARQFGQDGVAEMKSGGRVKFARLAKPIRFDRFAPELGLIHWSFDEATGNVCNAEVKNMAGGVFEARLEPFDANALESLRTPGRWGNALHFAGQTAGKISLAGLSTNFPRTFAFWMRVPAKSPLSEAGAAIAWDFPARKSGTVPLQISWNNNPAQGALGALRTEIGRTHQVGTTPLRDGLWHHVAVVLVPHGHASPTVQVKQYVDGRLEGGVAAISVKHLFPTAASAGWAANHHHILWLGARIGRDHNIKQHFHGDLDELFVSRVELTSQEINRLIQENKPDPDLLVSE